MSKKIKIDFKNKKIISENTPKTGQESLTDNDKKLIAHHMSGLKSVNKENIVVIRSLRKTLVGSHKRNHTNYMVSHKINEFSGQELADILSAASEMLIKRDGRYYSALLSEFEIRMERWGYLPQRFLDYIIERYGDNETEEDDIPDNILRLPFGKQ